jgi:hypothetical protein
MSCEKAPETHACIFSPALNSGLSGNDKSFEIGSEHKGIFTVVSGFLE